MPMPKCANTRCGRVHRKKGAYCSQVCEAQVMKQERKAKRDARRPGRPKNDDS